MNPNDPNLLLLEAVVHALGPLQERFVFVGGCTTGLLVTDVAAPPIRATKDVDAIVEVVTLADYHALERELQQAGFAHDRSADAPVCRWVLGKSLLDVMPADEAVLGFGNRWFHEAIRTAGLVQLPRGRTIRMITPSMFLATKLEAFRTRGRGDFAASHDLEDIITVVDGRPELVADVGGAPPLVRTYIAGEFRTLMDNPRFFEALPGHMPGDDASQARVPLIRDRLRGLSAI